MENPLNRMNQELLHKYFRGTASIEEEKQILDWVDASAQNRKAYLKERMFYDVALFSSKEAAERKPKTLVPMLRWASRIAAVIIVALAGYFVGADYFYTQKAQLQTITAPVGQRAQVTLADGTRVWLNSSSTLTYAANFGQEEREVTLDGEAYFEVAKNKKIPFFVHTEMNKVKVVGTCFNICAYKGSKTFEAALIEGIVDIYEPDKDKPITRLQKDEYFTNEDGKHKKGALLSQEYLRWREGLLCFDNVSFSQIITRLEHYYNVEFTIHRPNLSQQDGFTGKFRGKDGVEHILKVLSKEYQFSFQMNDTKDSVTIN